MASEDGARKSPVEIPPFPQDLEADALRGWIINVCKNLGITPSQLAKKAGISHTTLSRFLGKRENSKHLSGNTLKALSEAVSSLQTEIAVKILTDGWELRRAKPQTQIVKGKQFYNLSATVSYKIGYNIEFDMHELSDVGQISVITEIPIASGDTMAVIFEEPDNQLFKFGTILICGSYNAIPESAIPEAYLRLVGEGQKITGAVYRVTQSPTGEWWLIPTWQGASASHHLFVGIRLQEGLRQLEMASDVPHVEPQFWAVIAELRPTVRKGT